MEKMSGFVNDMIGLKHVGEDHTIYSQNNSTLVLIVAVGLVSFSFFTLIPFFNLNLLIKCRIQSPSVNLFSLLSPS